MFSYVKCVYTGVNVKNDDYIFHGDLFFNNGIWVLSGVPRESYYYEKGNPQFEAEHIFEIPNSGNYQAFILENLKALNQQALDYIRSAVPVETFDILQRKKCF